MFEILCNTCNEPKRVQDPATATCWACREKEYHRQHRRKQYHEKIKHDPELMALHREQSRWAMQAYRERKREREGA